MDNDIFWATGLAHD